MKCTLRSNPPDNPPLGLQTREKIAAGMKYIMPGEAEKVGQKSILQLAEEGKQNMPRVINIHFCSKPHAFASARGTG
jgi:hypothetical protein